MIIHCLNRGVGRQALFHKPEYYAAFERVVAHVLGSVPVRLLAYCLMPNHWHLLPWPAADGACPHGRGVRLRNVRRGHPNVR